ncbi:MAG: putative PEP-binding protein, partial [Planctomycetota bacterium]
AEFERALQGRDAYARVMEAHAAQPAVSPDGRRTSVMVNLESVRDVDAFDVERCDGTGLLRTEFLYLERTAFPSEEEQFRMYRRVVDAMKGRPVTVRTLDIGGDKRLPYFTTPNEANPALGWRGLRVTLQWQDLLRVQLRAAMRAAEFGPVRILLPMVSSADEVDAVHVIFDETREGLLRQGYAIPDNIDVGVMVEVPSTLWILEDLFERVDFVSVGTNDLVQYLLAVDRDNIFVSDLYEPLHPAVVRALAHIASAARAAGKSASVCGEIAGEEAIAVMLTGFGYDSLSVSPSSLAGLKFALSSIPTSTAEELSAAAVRASTAAEVREALDGVREELRRAVRARDPGADPIL